MALFILLGILLGISHSFLTRKFLLDKLSPKFITKRLKKYREGNRPKFFGLAQRLLSKNSKMAVHGMLWGPLGVLFILSFIAPLSGFIPAIMISSFLFTMGKFLDRNQNLGDYIKDTSRNWAKLGMMELLEEGSEQSVKLLQIASRSGDEKLKLQTYNYLIEQGDRNVTPILVDGLRTGASDLRNRLIQSLSTLNPSVLGAQLPALLTHRTSSTRVEAYKFVHLIDNEVEAESHLQAGLRDLDGKVRWEAAISFQKYQSRPAYDWLREFRSRTENVRFDAALGRLEGELNGTTWQTIKAARESMGEPGNEADLTALLNRMLAPVDPIQPIIEQLGQIQSEEAIDALVQLLGLKEVPIQRGAANILSTMGDKARLALVEALKSKNFRKRYGAIGALGYMNNEENLDVILKHLNDSEPKVRQMALRILRNHDGPKIIREILSRTDDNAYEVRTEALGALRKMGTMATIPVLLGKYKRLRKRSWENSASYKVTREMGEVGLTIGGVLARQPHKADDHRSLLCSKCMTRAVVRKEFQWRWAVCRKCSDSQHLVGGVLEVVGQIGGKETFGQEGHRAFVPVWDEKAKKAQFSDLDSLEIIGGSPMNYNWAVSAVIGTLQNDTTRKNVRIPVKETEAPDLDDNTQRLIKEIRA